MLTDSVFSRYLAGAIPDLLIEEEILDAADAWHAGEGSGLPLYLYLGFCAREYAAWAEGRMTLAQLRDDRIAAEIDPC